jgi:uncharacterized protein YndB with AHSA1/START domain
VPAVTVSAVIGAAPEAVWDIVSDPYHLPRWWPRVQRVEEATPEAWTTVMQSTRGKTVRADFSRLDADPPRRLSWRQEVEESPFERIMSEAVTEISLEPAAEDSTRVELRVAQRLRGLARFGGFMVKRATAEQLDEALDSLRIAVERER